MMQAPVIIPARAGSKGIKRKNIIPICGKPLIAWSILQAKASECVSEVYVSTDGDEIADISRDYGAKVIRRPNDISGEFASSEEAILHTMKNIEDDYDDIIFLQATSPLREKYDIDDAYKTFKKGDYDSLFSMAVMDDYTLWQGDSGEDMRSITFDYLNRGRRQDRKPIYLENGSIYIFKKELIGKTGNRMGGRIGMYQMPFCHSYEIDSVDEIEICEYYLNKILKESMT